MKKAARLNSSLLARKGFASPAAAVPMFGKANHYGHMNHHHIRDVVYDHVDPDESNNHVDLDPPQTEEPENAAPASTHVQEETPRGLMQRVQESLRSFNLSDDEPEPESVAQTPAPESATQSTEKHTDALQETVVPATVEVMANRPEGCCKGNPSSKRVAMTLRLDSARHLRLRVLSAHVNRSSQDILTEALDNYLDKFADMPEMRQCDCLRAEAEKQAG
jgi:predicted transcriptional regulator